MNFPKTDQLSKVTDSRITYGRRAFLDNGVFLKHTEFSFHYDMIYLLTAIGLSPGGSSTVHIYTQTVHITTQNKQYTEQHNNLGECGLCPVLASYTLAFALN